MDKLEAEGHCDDDWDPASPIEMGYKASGLKRYRIDLSVLGEQKKTKRETDSHIVLWIFSSVLLH